MGIAAWVGSVGAQRLAVPCLLVRSEGTDTSAAALQTRLLQKVQEKLADDEAVVCDRGFLLTQSQTAGMPRYISRGPINDPRFDEPLLLNTALPLTGAQLQALYLDR